MCEVGEYLNYASFKCIKRLADKLVEKCDEDIDESEVIYNSTLNDYKKHVGLVLYTLLIIKIIIIMGINDVWFYFYWEPNFFIAFYSSFYCLSYKIDLR